MNSQDTGSKRRSAKKTAVIAAVVIAAVLCTGFFAFSFITRKTHYVEDKNVKVDLVAIETETEAPPTAEEAYDIDSVKMVSKNRAANTYTMLVIGGDSPEVEEENGSRHDAEAIILMTINHNRGECYFTTLHTGMYAVIPGMGGNSLGSAYALGGGPLLAETITANYGIPIDNYAAISLKDVAREIEMPEFESMDISTQGLDVVEELLYGLNALNPIQVTGYINKVLPYVTHNMTSERMFELVLQVPRVIGYYSEKYMLPYDGLYQELEGYIVPDIAQTSERLQMALYGEEPPAQTEEETGEIGETQAAGNAG